MMSLTKFTNKKYANRKIKRSRGVKSRWGKTRGLTKISEIQGISANSAERKQRDFLQKNSLYMSPEKTIK